VSGRYRISEVPRSELRRFYAAADAFIFPSTTEPFGLVPIEAMACGTPVVASGVGGSAEFLSDGVNCLLFTPGDGPGLASTLLRLSADPSLRSGLVEGGAKTAEEYTVDRLADRLEEAHLSAIHRARGRA
jgi:glycosyltransferase involved in cell wall biosynthesis